MNYLITGGSGFIGSNLCEYLLDTYSDSLVVNLSKHTYAMNPRILRHLESNSNYKFIALDITDELSFRNSLEEYNIDVILHLAAETHVDRSFIYPYDFLKTNVIGTFHILEALRKYNRDILLYYMSTDEVFGDVPSPHKCKENESIAPRNPYSASKASAESYVLAYHFSYGLKTVIGRSMNNYGPRQHPEKLIAKIITRHLKNKSYTLYEGDAIRGWIFVKDTCEAIDYIVNNGKLGEIYHIPAKDYLSVKEVNDIIVSLFTISPFKGFYGRRLKDDERYALDGSKLLQLGWYPKTSFKEGIKDTIEWYKNNTWFWEYVYSP